MGRAPCAVRVVMIPNLSLLSLLAKPADAGEDDLPDFPKMLRPQRQREGADSRDHDPPNEGEDSGFLGHTANKRFGAMLEENESIALIAGSAEVLLEWHRTLRDAVNDGATPLEKMKELVKADERLRSPLAKATYDNDYMRMYIDITKFGRELYAARRRGKPGAR